MNPPNQFQPADFLAHAGAGRTLISYSKGDVIFSQGDTADAIFYLQKGRVKLSVVSNSGKEAVIAMLEPHGFFGEGCLGGQTQRMASAIAFSNCTTMRLDKTSVLETLASEPAFSELLLAYMLTRSIRIEADLVDQLFNSSEKRLARALLLLANFGKDGKPETVIPRISQETLAEMVGTTRSRVSFFMNKFRKLGFIRYGEEGDTMSPGTLEVHSSLLNVVLHD
ncbi:MAG TPA: Crp/Fnr family transcriptional regulator [Bryobacteraceae bacterium]|nr:Crp/Fnr family transcriptional regulator [Bryobacteraceae bacterium]